MTLYKLNTCTLCIGLGLDITGNCPKKNNCPFHVHEELLDAEISKFVEFLDKTGELLNKSLLTSQLKPDKNVTICIEIQ